MANQRTASVRIHILYRPIWRLALLGAVWLVGTAAASAQTVPIFQTGFEIGEWPLNDTGIVWSVHATSGVWTMCRSVVDPLGQDCWYGRDAQAIAGTLTKIGASAPSRVDTTNGFDYTKISGRGNELPASAELGDGPDDWACTRDNVTGLIWEVKTTSGLRKMSHTYTWYDSNSPDGNPGREDGGTCETEGRCDTEKYVEDVNATGLCGHGDWRMPTIKELQGITDLGRLMPAIDPDYFPNYGSWLVWSSSPNANDSNNAWYAHFEYGYSYVNGLRSGSMGVYLVRGRQPAPSAPADFCRHGLSPSNPDSIYLVHGDGTVTDTRTGIMWKQCMQGMSGPDCSEGRVVNESWATVLAYAEGESFAGYNDWRLPNAKELRSLVEECAWAPAINTNIFPNTSTLDLWSSTPYVNSRNSTWTIFFSSGSTGSVNRSNFRGMRLARGAE